MKRLLLSALIISPLSLSAQDLVEFQNGQVADADDMNANFSSLKEAIDALSIEAGATLLTGEGLPLATSGAVGDVYIDTLSYEFYGPKLESGWGIGVSLVGPRGLTGADGQEGPQGATGPKGDTGDTGAVGPQGATGATGPKGDKGDKGDAGPAGLDLVIDWSETTQYSRGNLVLANNVLYWSLKSNFGKDPVLDTQAPGCGEAVITQPADISWRSSDALIVTECAGWSGDPNVVSQGVSESTASLYFPLIGFEGTDWSFDAATHEIVTARPITITSFRIGGRWYTEPLAPRQGNELLVDGVPVARCEGVNCNWIGRAEIPVGSRVVLRFIYEDAQRGGTYTPYSGAASSYEVPRLEQW